MTATALLVKMAACPPLDGDGVDPENIGSTTNLKVSKLFGNNCQAKSSAPGGITTDIKLDGEKAYDAVASFEENDLRNLLEEVISQKQSKNDKSAIAQFLIRKEEDALKEESGSGEDTVELALGRQRKKRSNYRRDHCVGSHPLGSSAAARNNTGGSLGSLHNLSDPKVPEKTSNTTQSVATRSRAGGSCGNLSKGSFETHVCKRKSRKSREVARASTSQREGGSLQNLSKTEAASNEAKRLQKSESLSQVYTDVGGLRIKNRRQKTSSESSGGRFCRRSEDREPEESSEEEVEVPYQPLVLSSHSSVSGHSGDPIEVPNIGMVGTHWNEDHMSDVASGETTEEDGESMHISARAKLGDSTSCHRLMHPGHHNDANDTELHAVVTHTAHRDVLPTISSDSEVDKPIKFSLNKNQEDNMTTNHGTFLSDTAPCGTTPVVEERSGSKDDEVVDKRKLRGTKSDSGSFEKAALDENGNPVLMAVRSSVSGNSSSTSVSSVQASAPGSSVSTVSKKNGVSPQAKDISVYDRLRAKQDKKKAIKDKQVIQSEKTPGFRGDAPLEIILKFLGADESSNSKSKKKNKGKKDEIKEEKDCPKKSKVKGPEKSPSELLEFEKMKIYESSNENLSSKIKSDDNSNGNGSDNREKVKCEEDYKKSNNNNNNKKIKENDKKRGKKGSGMLRESSSVEDLVSKSKQNDNVKDVRKQVTVDDGDVSFVGSSPYSQINTPQEKHTNIKSEFSYDFYKVGDALLDTDPVSNESGDFEVVNRRKGKKAKVNPHTSHGARSAGGFGAWNGANGSWTNNNYVDDQRRSTYPRVNDARHSNKFSSQEKPQINFSEAPRTMHDGMFLSQWSGNRSGAGERYTTTTSAPHSEDSDSDGGDSDGRDSVHSMPAHTITPRPDVRKPPPSTDSTPQTSYANIAKLAASANKAQMKRVATTNHVGVSPLSLNRNCSEEESEKSPSEDADSQDTKSEHMGSILDDNFPPLAETLIVTGNLPAVTGAGSIKFNDNKLSIDGNHNNPVIIQQDISCVKMMATLNTNNELSLSDNNMKVNSLTFCNSMNQSYNTNNASDIQINIAQHIPSFPPPQAVSFPHSSLSPHNMTTVVKPIVPPSQFIYQVSPNQSQVTNSPPMNNVPLTNKLIPGAKPPPPPPCSQQPQPCGNSCNSISKETNDKAKSINSKERKWNGPSKHSTKTRDSGAVSDNSNSRSRKFEAAVVFSDNAKFEHSVTGIEFGYDISLETISNLPDKVNDKKISRKNVISEKNVDKTNNNNTENKNIKNLSYKKDYTKLYQAPKCDVINFNYEELCRHVSKAWESTLRMLEEDPKNIQYWKATTSMDQDDKSFCPPNNQ